MNMSYYHKLATTVHKIIQVASVLRVYFSILSYYQLSPCIFPSHARQQIIRFGRQFSPAVAHANARGSRLHIRSL